MWISSPYTPWECRSHQVSATRASCYQGSELSVPSPILSLDVKIRKWSPCCQKSPPHTSFRVWITPLLPTPKPYSIDYFSFPSTFPSLSVNISLCKCSKSFSFKENLFWLHILLSLLPGLCQLPWKHDLCLLNIFPNPLPSSSPFIWLPDHGPSDFHATDHHVANPTSIPHTSS